MSRFAYCILAMLLVFEATGATASAQGRGGGGSASAPGRMVRSNAAPAPARTGRGGAARGNNGPVARPPIAAANRHAGTPQSQIVMRSQRHVYLPPLYPPFYNGLYNPYWYSPYYSAPYVSSYTEPYYSAPAQSDSNGDLALQLQLLTRELELLRQDQAYSSPQVSPPPAIPTPPPSPPPSPMRAPEPPPAPITLVFRDGRRLDIQSYAIARQTLWVMGTQGSGKIALSELDLTATQRVNPGRTLLFNQRQEDLID